MFGINFSHISILYYFDEKDKMTASLLRSGVHYYGVEVLSVTYLVKILTCKIQIHCYWDAEIKITKIP